MILKSIFSRTSPTEPVKFTFEESLVEESAGKLLPNQLTVDNLTIEWLRNKQTELETGIKEAQEKRNLLVPSNHEAVNGKASPNNERYVAYFCFYFLFTIFRLHVEANKKEINELRCVERKLQRQSELIKSALNELGCEEAPPGCDLSIDNQNFISNSSEQVRNPRKLPLSLFWTRNHAFQSWFCVQTGNHFNFIG